MRKIVFLMMMAVSLSMSAKKKYVLGEPWPKKGYDLMWVTPMSYGKVEIQRFVDAPDLYYMKVSIPYDQQKNQFRFLAMKREVADSILLFTLTKEFLPKRAQRKAWLKGFLESTGFNRVGSSTSEWTLCKAQRVYTPRVLRDPSGYWRRFDYAFAWEAYCGQRNLDVKTGQPKKAPSPEAVMAVYNMVRAVLPIMAAGADPRPLYDQVVNPNGSY